MGIHQAMGRKLFFFKTEEITGEKRYKQLAESNYVFGASTKDDTIRAKDKRLPKTKNIYHKAINLWMK